MKRLFAALSICPDVEFLRMYRNLKAQLSDESIKWVEEHNIHITTRFFGETPEHKIGKICEILKTSSEQTKEIQIQLSKIGLFGSRYSPKVIWLGIEPYTELVSFMKRLQVDLQVLGYEPDRQNTVPHLTLGRIKMVKDKIRFQRVIDNYSGWKSRFQSFSGMTLYESILHREGPEYLTIENFLFKKAPEV